MKKEEVYIEIHNLTGEQYNKLHEITGLDVIELKSQSLLHFHEELNRWIAFGGWSEEPKKEVSYDEFIEIVNTPNITKKGEWLKGLFKWSITRPKNLTLSIDLNYWINIIILFISYSYIVGGYNVTQWSNRTVGVFMIIVLFYDAITNLNNDKTQTNVRTK